MTFNEAAAAINATAKLFGATVSEINPERFVCIGGDARGLRAELAYILREGQCGWVTTCLDGETFECHLD